MAENTDTPPPPPSYEEAVYILRDTPNISASDPSLARRTRNDQDTLPSSGRRSQQYLPAGTSNTPPLHVSDSPHSSDDEETAMLKAELRRLRDKDYNEQKKALLRQMVEEERRAAARANAASSDDGARGTRQDWHPPVQQQTYPAGTIVHPVASNIPGIAGPQPYAAPLQCPSTSAQSPGTSCAIEEPVMQDDKDNCTGCVGVFVCTLVVAVSAIVILFITLS